MSLVLKAQLSIGPDEAGKVDHSAELTSIKISATVDTVEVPATGTTPTHGRGGANDFSATFGYLSNDEASSFFQILWAALTTGDGTIYFEGQMREGGVSTSNPTWSGTAVVTEASVGAAAEALSTGSATFPLTGPPTKATS